MTKQDLIEEIYETCLTSPTRKQINEVLSVLKIVMATHLAEGETVEIPGIVQLKPGERAERTGRNPQTGAEIVIPAKRIIKAKARKPLDDAVEYYRTENLA